MATVTSADGTPIAYERLGDGPAVVLVDGAMCYREMGPSRSVAAELAPAFTVYIYDRRGRGESGDTAPYAVEREVEDLAAVIAAAGGRAHVWGISSGAALALEAARRGVPMETLSLYEAPFIVDGSRDALGPSFLAEVEDDVAAGRPQDAVKRFMRSVGAPAFFVHLLPLLPGWKKMRVVARTLPYDLTLVSPHQEGRPIPAGHFDGVRVPTLVIEGGKSPGWMRNAQRAIADAVPAAEHRTLDGQTHMVKARVLAPVLREWFARA